MDADRAAERLAWVMVGLMVGLMVHQEKDMRNVLTASGL